ncbi:unnamed protein product [Vitrella brassicaformis CCMP3155]|uniref:histone acetyltransferase n=1 Tax=Vitrella brassicaformis (strain CCMP3155) TaxID=1169540 RepID=A0A0G4EDS1_VITBC|nr:unnamed protein product [Vitrella brassicaformis CCMP3155]|eukprot:CEL93542.1 unnamed protein product [Vitrella brassicaformis CCMP3155]
MGKTKHTQKSKGRRSLNRRRHPLPHPTWVPLSRPGTQVGRLRSHLAACGLRIRSVKADCNCLFRAFADQITGDPDEHVEFRQKAMDYVEAHASEFEPFMEDGEQLDAYVSRMRLDSEWGGQQALHALCHLYQVNCLLHKKGVGTLQLDFFSKEYPCVQLCHDAGVHYDSVRLAGEKGDGPPKKLTMAELLDYMETREHPEKDPTTKTHKGGEDRNAIVKEKLSKQTASDDDGPPSKKQRLEDRVNTLKSVYFHPCESLKDYYKPPETFQPSFGHHFFDTDQAIMAVEEVARHGSVHICYIPDTFDVFVKVEGESPSFQASRERVMECLTKVDFPGGFCPSEHDFIVKLECRATRGWQFQPPGEHVGVLRPTAGAGDEQIEIEVRRCTFDESEFKPLHRRMEWFLHWFIEGMSEIDQDERWHVYLAYKRPLASPGSVVYRRKLRPRASSGRPGCLSLCGYVTTYTFWSRSMLGSRSRLSQFLIFPHYHRKGIGRKLYQLIYQQNLDDADVKEMAVEDPAPAFVQLRDVVTVKVAIDRNAVSPLALYPPPPGAEVPSSASAAVPASSGLGLTNGQSQPELPLDRTRNRTRALHKAVNDAGVSSGGIGAASSAAADASASAASGGMSRRSQKRRRSVGDGMDIDSGVSAVAARDVGMSTRSRARGRDGGGASSSSAAAAAAAAAEGGGGGSHPSTVQKTVNPDAGIPTIDCLVANLKETKPQATRMTELLQLARLLPLDLPEEIPPAYLAPGTAYRRSVEQRLRKDIKEPHIVSTDEEDFDFFKVCHTKHSMDKAALQDEYEKLVTSYFKSIVKLRQIFPPPPHIKAAGSNKKAAATELNGGGPAENTRSKRRKLG